MPRWPDTTIGSITQAARFGIPAFSINEQALSLPINPPEWGKQQKEEYDAQRYHRPTDEYRADMDFRTEPDWLSSGSIRVAGFVFGARDLEARR